MKLSELLASMFNLDELIAFIRTGPDGARLWASLERVGVSRAQLATDYTEMLAVNDLLDDNFQSHLLTARPLRQADIKLSLQEGRPEPLLRGLLREIRGDLHELDRRWCSHQRKKKASYPEHYASLFEQGQALKARWEELFAAMKAHPQRATVLDRVVALSDRLRLASLCAHTATHSDPVRITEALAGLEYDAQLSEMMSLQRASMPPKERQTYQTVFHPRVLTFRAQLYAVVAVFDNDRQSYGQVKATLQELEGAYPSFVREYPPELMPIFEAAHASFPHHRSL